MGRAYTPGLKVSRHLRHRVRRLLPISGDVLVKQGDRVAARDIVAQTFMPGDVMPLNLSNLLSLSPGEVAQAMLKQQGERIEVGEPLARTKGLFGFFKSEYRSKVSGLIESISDVTGQVIVRGPDIPVEVRAFLAGEVVETLPEQGVDIEAEIAFVQGIFGVGGEAFGPLKLACVAPCDDLTADKISDDMKGNVIIGGARMTGEAVQKAIEIGAAAVISGGMDDEDLRTILGYDLGVAITGSEQIGITVIITEGFGDIAMAERTFALLSDLEGLDAAVTGATQIRAGVMRPEIVIPLQAAAASAETSERVGSTLEMGVPVRIIRDPHFGLLGEVAGLPSEPFILESESKARVLEVKLRSGKTVTVPRANVELIEQ